MTALTTHGEELLETNGVELLVLEGAGHDLRRAVRDTFAPALIRHTGRVRW